MPGNTLQIQRFILLALASAGLLVLAYLLRVGWLQVALAELDARASLGMFRNILERTPADRGKTYLAWFHYLLLFALGVSFAQVLVSLLKPVVNRVLLTFNWGILLAACSGGLYFWAFGLQVRSGSLGNWLTIQSAVLCCALAMHAFGRAFMVFPAELSDARVDLYNRRYLRASAEVLASKRLAIGRWRRNMLAWQLRLGRHSRMGRELRKNRKHLGQLPPHTRLLMLYLFPGITFVCMSAYWISQFVLGSEEKWPVMLLAPAGLCQLMAWTMVLGKILMDYRLGDASVRRQVLWLLIGTNLPPLFVIGYSFAFLLPFIAPQYFGFAMMFMILFFPLLAYLFFLLCLMISIFFYGAIDPERILRVGALYSFLSLVLTVIFALLEQFLSPLLTGAIGLSGTTGALVAASVVALSFKPMHRHIEASVARVFQNLLRVAPAEANPESNPTKSDASASPG